MRQCPQCASDCQDRDRFCGKCGAPLPTASPPPAEPATSPATATPQPAGATSTTPRWMTPVLILGAIVASGLVYGVGQYFEGQNRQRRFKQIADASRGGRRVDGPATPRNSNPSRTSEDPPQPRREQAAPAPATSRSVLAISPGPWRFNWTITNVAGTRRLNPATPRSLLPIGKSGHEDRTITTAVVQNPGRYAFPMNPEANCRTVSSSMRNGAMEGSYRCDFQKDFGSVEATMTGTYKSCSIDTIVRIEMPIRMLVPKSTLDEMVHVFYRYTGQYRGGC